MLFCLQPKRIFSGGAVGTDQKLGPAMSVSAGSPVSILDDGASAGAGSDDFSILRMLRDQSGVRFQFSSSGSRISVVRRPDGRAPSRNRLSHVRAHRSEQKESASHGSSSSSRSNRRKQTKQIQPDIEGPPPPGGSRRLPPSGSGASGDEGPMKGIFARRARGNQAQEAREGRPRPLYVFGGEQPRPPRGIPPSRRVKS